MTLRQPKGLETPHVNRQEVGPRQDLYTDGDPVKAERDNSPEVSRRGLSTREEIPPSDTDWDSRSDLALPSTRDTLWGWVGTVSPRTRSTTGGLPVDERLGPLTLPPQFTGLGGGGPPQPDRSGVLPGSLDEWSRVGVKGIRNSTSGPTRISGHGTCETGSRDV